MKVGKHLNIYKEGEHLYIRLPSGRPLCYPFAEVRQVDGRFGMKATLTFMGHDSKTKQWCRQQTYGGKLTENVTQAFCRDVLFTALTRLRHDGHKVVMHVHDEIVVESDTLTLDHLNAILTAPIDWAEGLPLAAEGWVGGRYRK